MYSRLRTRLSSLGGAATVAASSESSSGAGVTDRKGDGNANDGLADAEARNTGEATVNKQVAIAELRKQVASLETDVTRDFLSDGCLDRYLRARNYDVVKARKMLQNSVTWRQNCRPDLIASTQLDTLRFESSTAKMFVLPHADTYKRSTIVMRTGLENSRDSAGKVANLVYTLERASRVAEQAGGERYVVIVDYTVGKISMATLPGVSMMKEITNILQGHYPERLDCMVLVQAPALFHTMFKIVKPLIDPKTRDKIHFVTVPTDVAYIPNMDRKALPVDFGGENKWTFSVDEYFAGEAETCAAKHDGHELNEND